MGNSFVRLSVDKTYYTAGDTVSGTVLAHSDKPVKVRSLDVYILGEEKVVIDRTVYAGGTYYHKAHYSTNDILNNGQRLLENTTLGPDDKTLPFHFQLHPNALPSYVGTFA